MGNNLNIKNKKMMNQVKCIMPLRMFTILCGLLLSVSTFAQQITVNGHIKDTSGEPIIGATIRIADGNGGTVSDLNGDFTLKTNAGENLTITYVGYQRVSVKATPQLTVLLKEDNKMLNDVVVIGYGTVKKSDLSGSVIAIKAEDINRGAVTSPQELLQGKVPGLFVQPGDGAPGSGGTIRIRGGASLNATNDPLIVIDGIPVSNDAAPGTPNALATINPDDIATFTVLKDASATAIYGSRASNGVIIITTKKGTSGKIKISYSGNFLCTRSLQTNQSAQRRLFSSNCAKPICSRNNFR
jgi:iron complex outermembrane receptor protein